MLPHVNTQTTRREVTVELKKKVKTFFTSEVIWMSGGVSHIFIGLLAHVGDVVDTMPATFTYPGFFPVTSFRQSQPMSPDELMFINLALL